MKRIDHRDRVGEIFVDIGKIGIVHVREKVSYGSAFLKRNRSEIRLCNVAAPASEHIETRVLLQKLNS